MKTSRWGWQLPEYAQRRKAAILRARAIAQANPGRDVEVQGIKGLTIRFEPRNEELQSGQVLLTTDTNVL